MSRSEIPSSVPEEPSKELERMAAVTEIRSALKALQGTLDDVTEENEISKEQALENLLVAFTKADQLHDGIDSPAWIKIETAITNGQSPEDIAALTATLRDDPQAMQLELAHLSDEMQLVDNYMEEFSPSIEDLFLGKMNTKVREILAKSGVKGEDLEKYSSMAINMIKSVIAGALEQVQGLQDIAYTFRFEAALDQAKRDRRLTDKEKAMLENPEELADVQAKWSKWYDFWLANQKAKNIPAPTIAKALHEDVPTVSNETKEEAKNTPRIAGLELGKELDIGDNREVILNSKTVVLSAEKISVNGKEVKPLWNGTAPAEVYLLANKEDLSDLEVRFEAGTTGVAADKLIEAIEQGRTEVSGTYLTFESVS